MSSAALLRRKRRKKKAEKEKKALMEEIWAKEDRPKALRKWSAIKEESIPKWLETKKGWEQQEDRKNLGEEAASRDARSKTIIYKKCADDGKTKLHKARFNRQPLAQPKDFYDQVPKKHSTVIRNFPAEHLGIVGQVPDAVIGHMHNRAVKVNLDSFVKATFKAGKGGEKGGKYPDRSQLEKGIINYCIMLHSLWPSDYTGLVMMKVLAENNWGENAGLYGRYEQLQ